MSRASSWLDSFTPRLDRESPYLRLQHVTLFVRDQDRSLRFYVEQLGFDLAIDFRFATGGRWLAVAPPDGTAIIGLVTPPGDTEEYSLIGRSRHVVFSTEDVHAKYREWSERGVKFRHPPTKSEWGGTVTTFEDPDGNAFALFEIDQMTRQVEEQRRSAAAKLESERLAAQEIDIAKQVQARLFPQTAPALKTLDYAGICIQARQVGGDYYDFLDLGRNRLGLVIGDISGKGIAAALLMANLQANLRSQCAIALDQLERVLRSVNRLFYENTAEHSYATLFFAEYNDDSRLLRYANCGHLSAILLRSDDSVERLASTGTVVGLFQDWDCVIHEKQVRPGDTLAIYTDGITEAVGDREDEFGEHRLIESLIKHRELPSPELLQAVLREVHQFSNGDQHDDVTLTVARCRE